MLLAQAYGCCRDLWRLFSRSDLCNYSRRAPLVERPTSKALLQLKLQPLFQVRQVEECCRVHHVCEQESQLVGDIAAQALP